MEHEYFKDRISAFHDKELKHEEEQMIAEHLETCQECQALLKQLEKLDRMVEKHSGLAGDDYFEKAAQQIEAAIEPPQKTEVVDVKPKSSWQGIGWKLAGVAASIAIITFIALHEREISDKVDLQQRKVAPSIARESVDRDSARIELKETAEHEAGSGYVAMDEDAAPVEEISTRKETDEGVVSEDISAARPGESKLRAGSTEDVGDMANRQELAKPEPPAATPPLELPSLQAYQSVPPGTVSTMTDYALEYPVAPDKEEEVLGEVGSAASGMNLDQWRQKRDSLQTIVNKSSGISAMLEPSQLAESTKAKAKQADKRELARMVDSISMEIQKQDPQLQLLECHYMVASMTENAKERDRSMSYLRDYLARDDSEYKLQAAWYLQRLEQAE